MPKLDFIRSTPLPIATIPPARIGVYDETSSMELYMQDVGQVKRLTQQEEIDLAKRIKKGDMAAREKFITANLPLVIKIAKAYSGNGLPLPDLISEGNIGLMIAVDKYNPVKYKTRFSTYATYYIKYRCRQAINDQSRTIRIPEYIYAKLVKLHAAERELYFELGESPSDELLADKLNVSSDRIKYLQSLNQAPESLNCFFPTTDFEQDMTMANILPDENMETAAEIMSHKIDAAAIRGLLNKLSERERIILTARFNLNGHIDAPMIFKSLGKRFRITRQRVQQIQIEALAKLKKMILKLDKLPYNTKTI
jgi:RNA polymerase primary sigma factor